MNADWQLTLNALCAKVAVTLAEGYAGSPNDRVRDLPDQRTVRYYTTLGLIDRPSIQGRTAIYGERQFLQLVAIKRLQANGCSLREIQERLLGKSNAELADAAQVLAPESPAAAAKPEAIRRTTFWKEVPPESDAPKTPPQAQQKVTLQGLPLSEGVLLVLPLLRGLDDFDLQAAQAAAQPLLTLLRTRKLIAMTHAAPSNPPEESS